VATLSAAIGWSTLSVLITVGQFALPVIANYHPATAIAITGTSGLILVSVALYHRETLHCIFRSVGLSFLSVFIINFFQQEQSSVLAYNGWVLAVALLLTGILIVGTRLFLVEMIYNKWLKLFFRRQVGIIGSNEEAKAIATHIIYHNAPFWVAGTIGNDHRLNARVPKECLGSIVELPNLVRTNQLAELIVTDENLDKRTLISLLDFGLSNRITIWFTPKLLPIIDRKLYIDNFCGIPMIRMCSQKRVEFFNRIKHAIDAAITLPLFIALLPIFGAIAAAIKINSKGPVFYRARAIGKNGLEFRMFKFRSMYANNDNSIHKNFVTKLIKGEIGKVSSDDKPLKITDDPRVTRVGHFLRKYSLDELPQLINVLSGKMSLIGPRPCLPYEFDIYQDWYKKRAAIRPGITGLWQVAGRSEVEFEEMILLDLYYLYNRSLWMDLLLLIETAFVILKKKGAY
jgi:exopolysaccharide biosynthesis polyprenyl glycosylphosphotransferase